MKHSIDKFVFMLYLIPFVFIEMFADWHGQLLIGLLLMVFALALATHFMWYGAPKWILLGNVISFVVSLLMVMVLLPASEVGFFYKPFGPVGTLVLFSVLFYIFQYAVAWLICKLGKRFS